jgi:CHAT domain-containing protein
MRCNGDATQKFAALPAAHEELTAIASLWKADTVTTLEGAAATESAFKRQAGKFRVLHLATHGFFLDEPCSQVTMDGTRGVGGLTVQGSSLRDSSNVPLQLSGLALAGANRSQGSDDRADDGILTAEEIAVLDLRSVEWAVLSACDTGVGVVQDGEGVLGLRRAFHLAGAQASIMSLQRVRDEVARDWMRALYEGRLGNGLGTAAAVRNASLELLGKRRENGLSTHPSYWAPFVASGNWN